MPSKLGRIALMIPVTLALCDAFGLGPGRPGRTGAVLAVGVATPVLSAAILPANVPNLVMAGSAERLLACTSPTCLISSCTRRSWPW